MPANLLEDLRHIPLLSKLADHELSWLAENGTELVLAPGDVVIRAGDRADGMVIILEGMIESRQPPGQPGGRPRSGRGRVTSPACFRSPG